MSNYILSSTPMIEGIYLVPAPRDFISNAKDFLAYKWFIESVQWLVYQTCFDILQIVSKLSYLNMKPTD